MLWFNGRGPDERSDQLDGFMYFLAHELHKTVMEVEQMPAVEYMRWNAYFTAKRAVENLKPVSKS